MLTIGLLTPSTNTQLFLSSWILRLESLYIGSTQVKCIFLMRVANPECTFVSKYDILFVSLHRARQFAKKCIFEIITTKNMTCSALIRGYQSVAFKICPTIFSNEVFIFVAAKKILLIRLKKEIIEKNFCCKPILVKNNTNNN